MMLLCTAVSISIFCQLSEFVTDTIRIWDSNLQGDGFINEGYSY